LQRNTIHKFPGIYWFGNISTAPGVLGFLFIPCTADEVNANIYNGWNCLVIFSLA